MSVITPTRPPAATRRVGHLAGVLVTAVMFYLVNVSPGWEAVPFLTADTERVLGLVNASLLAGVLAGLVYTLTDPAWVRAAGGLVTTAIGVAALVRLWQVFPFDFSDASIDWAPWMRAAIVLGLVGSAIGVIANVVTLVRAPCRPSVGDGADRT
jgi:hypothetical protein